MKKKYDDMTVGGNLGIGIGFLMFSAIAGALMLGKSDDFDCDCDHEDCDHDGCDHKDEHDHDDCIDRMFKNAARSAEDMQWHSHYEHKSSSPKGLLKRDKSELNRIRRRAFLWKHKKIRVGYDSEDLINKKVEKVNVFLYNQAFKNIRCVPLKIIDQYSVRKVGAVDYVDIDGVTRFNPSVMFPYDAPVTIYYLEKKEIEIPYSAKSLRNKNYSEIYYELVDMGFANVKCKGRRSILTGLRKNDGAIDKVCINGDFAYEEGTCFQYDAEIVIEYHTYLF